ncbi:hypothetical protein RF11_06488 [Thelohanellus kitauei]|uniref:Uncharacterized protein n=1 Tax=Thelohanellus kitauei TaxID=669202 RepID=A0A0C2N3V3_THEKT|nr:hypothetical protein RF11_06488 [Thelohanellus kitauei]
MLPHTKELTIIACSLSRNEGVHEGYERYDNDKKCCEETVPPLDSDSVLYCEKIAKLIWSCAEELLFLEKLNVKQSDLKSPKVVSLKPTTAKGILKEPTNRFTTKRVDMEFKDIPQRKDHFKNRVGEMALVYPAENVDSPIKIPSHYESIFFNF